jgi:hypothetical protein
LPDVVEELAVEPQAAANRAIAAAATSVGAVVSCILELYETGGYSTVTTRHKRRPERSAAQTEPYSWLFGECSEVGQAEGDHPGQTHDRQNSPALRASRQPEGI